MSVWKTIFLVKDMKKLRNIIKCIAFAIMLAMVFAFPVSAAQFGSYSGGFHGGYHGYVGYYGGYYGWRGPYHGWWHYGGWWYPWAVIVPVLPVYYETIWIGGYPYYYADGVYYAPTPRGYMVVDQPEGDVSRAAPTQAASASGGQMFVYPRNGQSEKQLADDRYQCHRWAVGQTGYDPTNLSGPPSSRGRTDYQRAMAACLDGRGYTAR